MKKILIYTISKSYNFGAFLQAFALKKVLEGSNFNVSIARTIEKTRYSKFRFILKKDIRKIFFNIMQARLFEKSWLETKNTNKSDIAILGSDEIWNVNNKSFYHDPKYFGYNIDAANIISYAPSCGSVKKEDLIHFDKNINFNKINHISVRDKKTYELVNNFNGLKPKIVLDPTLLLKDYSEFEEKINVSKKYILIYGYGFSKEKINNIRTFARNRNLKLISIGMTHLWCDKNVQATPFQFLSYIKQADYVITETFHGTIFSIIYNKQFITYATNKQKIIHLLQVLELSDRNADSDYLFDNIDEKINYDNVNSILDNMRRDSLNWLLDSISN